MPKHWHWSLFLREKMSCSVCIFLMWWLISLPDSECSMLHLITTLFWHANCLRIFFKQTLLSSSVWNKIQSKQKPCILSPFNLNIVCTYWASVKKHTAITYCQIFWGCLGHQTNVVANFLIIWRWPLRKTVVVMPYRIKGAYGENFHAINYYFHFSFWSFSTMSRSWI